MDKAEELDPLQRRVLEYTIRFSKLDSESAKELTEQLIKEAEIDRGLAVQIINAMPTTVPEIRTFLGRQRIIAEDTLNKILDIIDNQNLLKNAEAAAEQQPLEKREINLTSIKQEGEQQTNPSQVTNKEGNTYDTYDHLVNKTDTEAKVTQQPPQGDPVQKYQDPIEKESTADTKQTQTLSSDEEHTTNIRPAIKHKEVQNY